MTILLILLVLTVLVAVACNAFVALRSSVVSKARQKAREAVFSAPSGDYFAMSEAYYAAGTYDDMLWSLGKWRFTDFYGHIFKEQK